LTERAKVGDTFYRYEIYGGGVDEDGFERNVEVVLHKHEVARLTPACTFVRQGRLGRERRILDSAEKKWAYPTKELALKSFIRRKGLQVRYAEHELDVAKRALELARRMQEESVAVV
jgi:hypothetical protein